MHRFDTPLVITVGVTLAVGIFVFLSAALGLLASRDVSLSSLIIRQGAALVIGIGALIITANINYRWWRTYAFHIFGVGIVGMLLVFIPGLGIAAGGATRWIDLGILTVQPAEFFKFAFVVFFSAWLASFRTKLPHWRYGLVPTAALIALAALLFLLQPDTGTFMVIALTGVAMYFVAGARWRDLAILAGAGLLLAASVVFVQPYILERISTYINPALDPTGAGYQIRQSLIAIGSGEITGRGFGQSVQKFNYLPEPIGDSIFAVAAEEFGFIGSIILITLFLTIALRGLKIAAHARDYFGTYLVLGISMLIFIQSFVNIGAMLNLIPLTGIPLLFISQGGTALVIVLAEVGIMLNVARYGRH